jgi:cyanophycinase
MNANGQPGAIALLGSGEYLDVMNETDSFLVERVGGRERAYVALLPTASGLEPESPQYWNDLGQDHFKPLAAKVSPLWLIKREDAEDENILSVLRQANIFYFSGGSPPYLVETLEGTSAWAIIQARLRQGAVIAGCSAGAIMLGEYRTNLRGVIAGEPSRWERSMGIVPGLAVMPHFDRNRMRIGEETLRQHLRIIADNGPPGALIAGIEEDTALVGWSNGSNWRWQVQGRQSVWLVKADQEPLIFGPSDTLPVELLQAAPLRS